MQMHNPPHPGRLLAYFVEGRSITEVAAHLGVTRATLSRVLNGHSAISADMALRLSEAFPSHDAAFWLRLQLQRDLWEASRRKRTKVKEMPLKLAA